MDRRSFVGMAAAAAMAGATHRADAVEIPGLKHGAVRANGIRQHYVEAGSGPPVVLLHGFPETSFAWRNQMWALGERFRVIAPDLRGYGDTDKPETGYDKRTMALDVKALMEALGVERAPIVGHDRGARVATRFAKDHPQTVERLAVVENIPTRVIFETLDAKKAKTLWFFLFNQLPDDLPEALIGGREEIWLRYLFSRWCFDPEALSDEDIEVYVKAYQQAGAVHGACNDYRAGAVDLAQDEADASTKIACPTLALWGRDSELVGKMFDVEAVWRTMATDLTTVSIPECGHLPHEERPGAFNQALLRFLDSWRG